MTKSKIKVISFVLLLGGLFALFRLTPLSQYLTKEYIIQFIETIRGEWWGPVVFILIYALLCAIALPGSILTLAGGAAFGTVWGTFYNVLASNLGATLAFFIARYFGREFVKRFSTHPKWAQMEKGIQESGFKTVFRLRLLPVVPFNVLNYGSGFSSVRYTDYLFGSMLGMLPATFIYTYFADSLVQGVQGANQKAILNLCVASALLIFISFVPTLYKKFRGAPANEAV